MPKLTVMRRIVSQRPSRRYDPRAVGRYLRYWYTYRTAVAVVIALALSGSIYWLYTQQVACDAHLDSCVVNISVHPEDRFAPVYDPGPDVVIVGIDDASLPAIGRYPVPRDLYATALKNLEKAGAQTVAFDIAFPDPSGNDDAFAKALKEITIPVVLSYGAGSTDVAGGKVVQRGVDEIPLRRFWCADASTTNGPCSQQYPNVVLGSADLLLDRDGVLRRVPLAVRPACYARGTCTSKFIDTFGFAAY